MPDLRVRVDTLEDTMKLLAEAQINTQAELSLLSREMKEFKDETRDNQKEMNKQWGALSNKLGTIVEDIIAPAVMPAVNRNFNREVLDFAVKVRRYIKAIDTKGEFDVIAVCEDMVFLVEAKSSPAMDNITSFHNTIERFNLLFPEYTGKKLIPIIASIYIPEELIQFCTKEGFYDLAFREWEYMDILNFEDIQLN